MPFSAMISPMLRQSGTMAIFSVPSPAPVKAVLNHLGLEVGPLRLPLVACTSEEAKRIIKVVLEEDVEATRETVTGVVRPDY